MKNNVIKFPRKPWQSLWQKTDRPEVLEVQRQFDRAVMALLDKMK